MSEGSENTPVTNPEIEGLKIALTTDELANEDIKDLIDAAPYKAMELKKNGNEAAARQWEEFATYLADRLNQDQATQAKAEDSTGDSEKPNTKTCPKCGFVGSPEAKFCGDCGAKLT